MVKTKMKKRILTVFTILTFLLVGVFSMQSSRGMANAGFLCPNLGSNLNVSSVSSPHKLVKATSTNRKWNVYELLNNGVGFTSYYGEREGGLIVKKVDNKNAGHSSLKSLWSDADVINNISRGTLGAGWRCATSALTETIPGNMLLSISGAIIGLANWAVRGVLGEDWLTASLVSIIGGSAGKDAGIIDMFLNSLYFPLIGLGILGAGVAIAYKGLVQAKLREALNDALWVFGAFIIGLVLMFNPQMLVGIPQQATNIITTCVIGGLSGQNCLTDKAVEAPSTLVGRECQTSVGGESGSIDTMMAGMNCTIWKTFILEPWAEKQFGYPYNELYTAKIPNGGSKWKDLQDGTGDNYCVSMKSTAAASTFKGKTVKLDGSATKDTVCNVALYQAYLKTDAHDIQNHSSDPYKENEEGQDERWYNIILPTATNDSSFRAWSGSWNAFSRAGTGVLAVISSLAATFILVILSIMGASYKVAGVLLMALAPIFFLFAVVPGRGKKIFLGWVESVVASILKYFAITMLIVVALVMYSGVLQATSGMTSVIAVIILTATLRMYQQEIVDLIGAANFGGQQMSNKWAGVANKAGDKAKQVGGATVGGAIGGAKASGENRKRRIKERKSAIRTLENQVAGAKTDEGKAMYEAELKLEKDRLKGDIGNIATRGLKVASEVGKGSFVGGRESGKRIMKRGTGVFASMYAQSDRSEREIKRHESERLRAERAEGELTQKAASIKYKEDNKGQEDIVNDENNNTNNSQGNNNEGSNIQGNNNEVDKFNSGKKDSTDQDKSNDRSVSPSISIDNVREKMEYPSDITPQEKLDLDNLAKQITGMSDEELIGKSAEIPGDDANKTRVVTNELNARIKANTMNGKASGALSRHKLADNRLVSDEELKLNVEVLRDNYIEDPSPSNENRLREALSEDTVRSLPEAKEGVIRATVMKEVISTKSLIGQNVERKTATESELNKNPELGKLGEKVSTPNSLAKEKEDLVDRLNKEKDSKGDKDDKGNKGGGNGGGTLPPLGGGTLPPLGGGSNQPKPQPEARTDSRSNQPKQEVKTDNKNNQPKPQTEARTDNKNNQPKTEVKVDNRNNQPKPQSTAGTLPPLSDGSNQPQPGVKVDNRSNQPQPEVRADNKSNQPKTEERTDNKNNQPKPQPTAGTLPPLSDGSNQPKPQPEVRADNKSNQPKPEVKVDNINNQPKPEVKTDSRSNQPKPEVKTDSRINQPKPEVKVDNRNNQPKQDVKEDKRGNQPSPDVRTDDRNNQPKQGFGNKVNQPEPKVLNQDERVKPNIGSDGVKDMLDDLIKDFEK